MKEKTFSLGFEISNIFTMNTMKQIASVHDKENIRKLMNQPSCDWLFKPTRLLDDFFDSAYQYLLANYKNEYVFKNTLITEYAEDSDVTVLSEFPIKKCIADLIFISDKLEAFEIKTDFDNYSRLRNQMDEYRKVFEYVNLVISEDAYKKLQFKEIGNFGIIVLKSNNTFVKKRKPKSNIKDIEIEYLWRILNKAEKEFFLKDYGFETCKSLFDNFDSVKMKKIFYEKFITILRNRKIPKKRVQFIERVPISLKAFAYQSKFSNTEMEIFKLFLKQDTQFLITKNILEESNVLSFFKGQATGIVANP